MFQEQLYVFNWMFSEMKITLQLNLRSNECALDTVPSDFSWLRSHIICETSESLTKKKKNVLLTNVPFFSLWVISLYRYP